MIISISRYTLLLLSLVTMAITIQSKVAIATTYILCNAISNLNEATFSQGKNKEEQAQAYYLAAHDCYRTKAIEYFTTAIDLNPGLVKTYISYSRRGKLYEETRKEQLALADYTKAISLIPNVTIAYLNRGALYEELGEYQKAIDDYSKAIEVDSNSALAYVARGKVVEKLGEEQLALQDYNQAIEKQPYLLDAYLTRGDIYQKLNKYQNAINDYTKAITLINDFTEIYFEQETIITSINSLGYTLARAYRERGHVYQEIKQYSKALDDFTQSNFFQPLPSEFYFSRGEVYQKLADYQKALNDYTRVISSESANSAKAYLGIGYIYRDLQKSSKAINSFRQAAYLFRQQGNREQYQTALDEIDRLKYSHVD